MTNTDHETITTNGLSAVLELVALPKFLLYILGNTISLTGSSIQRIAILWFLWNEAKSTAVLGLFALLSFGPSMITLLYGGLLADTVDQMRIITWSKAVLTIQALVLVIAVPFDMLSINLVLALAVVQSLIYGINQPSNLAFISNSVPRRLLGQALTLNTVGSYVARVSGPLLGGWILSTHGLQMAFVVNFLSYLPLFAAIAIVGSITSSSTHVDKQSSHQRIAGGFQIAVGRRDIAVTLTAYLATAVTIRSYADFLPAIVDGSSTDHALFLGYLNAAIAVGALLGTLPTVYTATNYARYVLLIASNITLACAVVFLFYPTPFPVRLLLALVAGMSTVIGGVGAQTILASLAEDSSRGRVLSIYTLIFRGGPAASGAFIGVVAAKYGMASTFAAASVLCGLVSAVAWRERQQLRVGQ
ncbi:MFS transporter [Bosea vaviloviae]|uniref:Major facilitator superfamily (MFS) profile domain-containing protein n=1 Tax=Bosea vaviloviae TaxID=1526658 RepID=A0A1D7UCK3_9HYPH|nr:MFS transporter [Bosea vaviloviae]AOO85103.1 hypothetical protein BHK69_30885 [Bosea vaviloviae]